MKITDLISELQKILNSDGNLEVLSIEGEIGELLEPVVTVQNTSKPFDGGSIYDCEFYSGPYVYVGV